MKENYEKTIKACFVGYIVQAIINNFLPLLFVRIQSSYSIPLSQITVLVTFNFGIQLCVDLLSVKVIDKIGYRISMIVAPAYILSKKLGITFGQSEYIIQAILFIVFCIIVKKIKPIFLVSFLTCLIYGWILDLWRVIIPAFNPQITPPGTLDLWVRIVFFIVGMVLTSLAVALSFKAYIYPQVYDFFVSETTKFYNISVSKFKTIFN